MASVATATAIVAVAATVIVVRSVAANQPAAGISSGAAVPRFFVATVATKIKHNQAGDANEAVVGNTATGKVLAAVLVPAPYNEFTAVSAAADDRTFVLAAQKTPRQSGLLPVGSPTHSEHTPTHAGGSQTRFYLLRFHPGQVRSIRLTTLPIPVLSGDFLPEIALSPSGTRLAVQLQPSDLTRPAPLRVYDLTNGSVRTWSVPKAMISAVPGINSPSWDGGSRFLATLVYAKKGCRTGCVQLLDTTHADGNILTASKTIFATSTIHRFASWEGVAVSPDGSRMLLTGEAGGHPKPGETEFDTPLVYDIATPSGYILSHQVGRRGQDVLALWVGARADRVILGHTRNNDTITVAIYGQHTVLPLHLPAGTMDAAW